MAGGRPTKYKEEYCDDVLEFVGGGKSITQFAKHLKISKATIYLWADAHPAFMDALSTARDWSQAEWEDKLEEMMYDTSVNSPLVKLYFANRFKWHDRPAEDNNKPVPITIEVVNPHVKD